MKIAFALCALLLTSAISLNAADKGDKPKVDPEAAFKKKDTNGDGKLSKEEFTKGSKDAAKSEAAFAAKDKDKDGFLTLEEFKAGGKKKDK